MSNNPSNTEPTPPQNDENKEHDTEKSENISSSPTVNEEETSNVTPHLPVGHTGIGESKDNDANIPSSTPTAHRSATTSEKIESLYPAVIVEDIGETDSPVVTTSASRSGELGNRNTIPDGVTPGGVICSSNNNMAMVAVPQIATKTSQMIPIALLRKSSNSTAADECSGNVGAGIMHLITGNNKVAPAEAACTSDPAGTMPTTTVGAVLMLIPKKSDCVCVDIPVDLENNPPVEMLDQQADPNCRNAGSSHHDVIVRATQSYDSYEEVCRICHDNPSKMELISPCLCKGSMSKVHRACLERWLAESAKNSCEICNYEYNTVRKPKYKGCRSLYQWIRHPLSPSDMRNLFFDIACFFILTPLAAISSWLCVVGAQHYTFGDERRRRAKFRNEASALWDVHGHDPRGDASNATWTSVGLLSLTGTLLVAYSVWLFVAIKYHIQAWREWQQRNYTVTIVPFEDGCMGRPPPPRPPRDQSNNNNNNGSLLGASDIGHNSIYNFDANPNLLRYSGHSSLMRGRGGRNIFRQNRHNRRNYNVPPLFSRNHFLRNPPPGYTISETTLLYQALYGSDSDTFLNENFLAFFADSSDDVTESTSPVVAEYNVPNNFATTALPPPQTSNQEQRQHSSTDNASSTVGGTLQKKESTGFATAIDVEFAPCSSGINNNNQLINGKVAAGVSDGTGVGGNKSQQKQENQVSSVASNDNDSAIPPMSGADDVTNNEKHGNEQGKTP